MLSLVTSCAATGIEGQLIQIECDMSSGLPGIRIVGLPARTVDEAKERVRSAITNSRLKVPPKRITLNLAPADVPKEGSSYDLSLAVAILAASEQIPASFGDAIFCGELALDGSLRPVPGAIIASKLAAQTTTKRMYVTAANAPLAATYPGTTVYPVSNLRQLYLHLLDEERIDPLKNQLVVNETAVKNTIDIADIYGQEQAKRAIQISAAGGHNLLMTGPPGVGKTLLARAISGILPPLTQAEAIDITQVYSTTITPMNNTATQRPFRAPHHSSSDTALLGGGKNLRPGEISLSHHGILFMDELPEFSRRTLEALRQPLETDRITILRAAGTATYPAHFTLVATRNPCPCGYYADPVHDCTCSGQAVNRYNAKISGPLLDRIDLHVTLQRPTAGIYNTHTPGESSDIIRRRVTAARQAQLQRQGALNSRVDAAKSFNAIPDAVITLQRAVNTFALSTRAYLKTLAIARTIADLEQSTDIEAAHVTEALQYRLR